MEPPSYWRDSPTPDKYWSIRNRLMDEGRGRCYYCQREFSRTVGFTLDHVIPLSMGGWDEYWNLVQCCQSCNSSKGGIEPRWWAWNRLPYRLMEMGANPERTWWHCTNIYWYILSVWTTHDAFMAAPLYEDYRSTASNGDA